MNDRENSLSTSMIQWKKVYKIGKMAIKEMLSVVDSNGKGYIMKINKKQESKE